MPDNTPTIQQQLSRLYTQLGHIRARVQQMGPEEEGRKQIYQDEAKRISEKILELKRQ